MQKIASIKMDGTIIVECDGGELFVALEVACGFEILRPAQNYDIICSDIGTSKPTAIVLAGGEPTRLVPDLPPLW